MKKTSAAGARQTRNFVDQKLTIGLDLGDRSNWYCVLDEAGEVACYRSPYRYCPVDLTNEDETKAQEKDRAIVD